MKLKLLLAFLFAVACSAISVYVYTLIDPRLEIILLKNEEILQLDNKIAELSENNIELSKQVESIASVVKASESKKSNTGKINDEYKLCLRKVDRIKKKSRRVSAELSLLKNKNKILQEYVSVKNDVTSLKEQIAILNGEKKDLSDLAEQLGPIDMNTEGGALNTGPVEPIEESESSGIPPVNQ